MGAGMASKKVNWLAILSNFVRDHPKTSAMVAFNLGIMAARATKSARRAAPTVSEIPSKLIELVPSIKDLGGYLPMIGTSKSGPKPGSKPRRKARKNATKSARRPARRAAARH
jgi:hypothetical protein